VTAELENQKKPKKIIADRSQTSPSIKYMNKIQMKQMDTSIESPNITKSFCIKNDGSTTDRKRAASKLREISDKNRIQMKEVNKKVIGMMLSEIKREMKK